MTSHNWGVTKPPLPFLEPPAEGRCPSVLEYLLLGPADTERCGHLAETWGGPLGFANRGKDAKMPGYAAAGFVRHDLEELRLGVSPTGWG